MVTEVMGLVTEAMRKRESCCGLGEICAVGHAYGFVVDELAVAGDGDGGGRDGELAAELLRRCGPFRRAAGRWGLRIAGWAEGLRSARVVAAVVRARFWRRVRRVREWFGIGVGVPSIGPVWKDLGGERILS